MSVEQRDGKDAFLRNQNMSKSFWSCLNEPTLMNVIQICMHLFDAARDRSKKQ
jgi:hypothetical protein